MQGPVKVELVLPAHLRGIHAEPVTIAADQSSAEVSLRFTAEAKGPFNGRVVLRATLIEKGEPVVAEAALSLVPPR
jgi:hypothetical protein